jgi:transcriptional regulator with XRE-family HTH domain
MHVYILQHPEGLIKIGFTSNPTKRLRMIETQGGFDAASVWVSVPTENARASERKAHQILSDHRVIGEWFEVEFDTALDAVLDALSNKIDDQEDDGDFVSPNSIRERLTYALNARGLNQQQFADLLGLKKAAVNHWFTGHNNLRLEHVEPVSKVLGISPAWLAFGLGPIDDAAIPITECLSALTPSQRAQAIRMLEAFAMSCAQENDD